jgi:hypothetical protein
MIARFLLVASEIVSTLIVWVSPSRLIVSVAVAPGSSFERTAR